MRYPKCDIPLLCVSFDVYIPVAYQSRLQPYSTYQRLLVFTQYFICGASRFINHTLVKYIRLWIHSHFYHGTQRRNVLYHTVSSAIHALTKPHISAYYCVIL